MSTEVEQAGIEIVARREPTLTQLVEEPLQKPGLVDALDQSRSTVDRAIGELEGAGFVTRTRDGYGATTTGRLALERFRQFVAEQEAVVDASDVLAALPPEPELPLSLCEHGRVEQLDSPYHLFDRLAAELRDADRYRAILPEVVDSRHLRLCHRLIVEGALDGELLVAHERLRALGHEYPTLCAELVDEGALRVLADPPSFALSLITSRHESVPETTVRVVSYGDPVGVLETPDTETIEWAREYYEQCQIDSRTGDGVTQPVEPASGTSVLDDGRLPLSVRSEGFVKLDDEYTERHEPMEPTTAWRAGLGLPEVQAGYALPRRPREEAADAEWFAAQIGRAHV